MTIMGTKECFEFGQYMDSETKTILQVFYFEMLNILFLYFNSQIRKIISCRYTPLRIFVKYFTEIYFKMKNYYILVHLLPLFIIWFVFR